MKKIIANLFLFLYAIIAIFITMCLISYNSHRVTVFGNLSFVIVDNKNLEPGYSKGDLVIVKGDEKPVVGDDVFFYNTYESKTAVSVTKITGSEKITDKETTYTLDGGKSLSSENVIGKANGATKISVVGNILNVLESKWGYLFLIVLPSLLAFLYEIIEIVKEIKGSKNK